MHPDIDQIIERLKSDPKAILQLNPIDRHSECSESAVHGERVARAMSEKLQHCAAKDEQVRVFNTLGRIVGLAGIEPLRNEVAATQGRVGLCNGESWDFDLGTPLRSSQPCADVPLTQLREIAEEQERIWALWLISGSLLDGVSRRIGLHPISDLRDETGIIPVAHSDKPRVRKHCYVRIRGRNALAHQLWQIGLATSAIFHTRTSALVAGARAVPVYLFRKVSRGVNLGVVLAFLHSEERFVFMENEKCPNGRALHGRYLGGVGQTMFEWLHVPGVFLRS
jgi:hypothetical protein